MGTQRLRRGIWMKTGWTHPFNHHHHQPPPHALFLSSLPAIKHLFVGTGWHTYAILPIHLRHMDESDDIMSIRLKHTKCHLLEVNQQYTTSPCSISNPIRFQPKALQSPKICTKKAITSGKCGVSVNCEATVLLKTFFVVVNSTKATRVGT